MSCTFLSGLGRIAAAAAFFFVFHTHAAFAQTGSSDDPGQESRVLNGQLSFQIEGDEFRGEAPYPADNAGSGFFLNAQADLQQKCASLAVDLQTRLADKYVSLQCLNPVNINTKATRAQFLAQVNLQLNYAQIVSIAVTTPVTGAFIEEANFPGATPWQDSRQAARFSYAQACAQYTATAQAQYGQYFLFVDCGKMIESGRADGWQYSSTPTVYFYDDGPVPASCGAHPHHQRWYEPDPTNTIQVPVSCQFGGDEENVYQVMAEKICDNGVVDSTGRTMQGSLVQTIGACYAPSSCGNHPHGSSWWQDEPGQQDRVPDNSSCQFGGDRYNIYQRQQLMTCYNGNVRSAGNERDGAFLGSVGQCYSPASCGGHPSGSSWYETNGTMQDTQPCPRGQGFITIVYEREQLYTCYDGTASYAGGDQRGSVISRFGSCDDPHPGPGPGGPGGHPGGPGGHPHPGPGPGQGNPPPPQPTPWPTPPPHPHPHPGGPGGGGGHPGGPGGDPGGGYHPGGPRPTPTPFPGDDNGGGRGGRHPHPGHHDPAPGDATESAQ